jgi:hypothetical protein
MGRYQAQQIQFATVAAALAVQRERVAVKAMSPIVPTWRRACEP